MACDDGLGRWLGVMAWGDGLGRWLGAMAWGDGLGQRIWSHCEQVRDN